MINVAILGAGVGQLHLQGYRQLIDQFSVRMMCDLDADKAAAAREGDKAISVVTSITDVLDNPEIDMVDICLPPHLHMPTVLKVLEAGKHAICEKPIGRSLADVQRMQQAMEQYGGQVWPVFQYRYGLGLARLVALRDAGLAGRALVASAETHWNRGADYYAVPWRGTWAGEAGGAVLGHAIHSHDILCHVLGPVSQLTAYTDTRVNTIETEDCAAISMRMQNGALVTSSVTLGAGSDETRLKFCFENLTAQGGDAPYTPAEDVWTFTARDTAKQGDIDAVLDTVHVKHAGFAGYLEAIGDAIEGRGGSEVSFADGQRSIELVTAIYLSSRQGRAVSLPLADDETLFGGWVP